MEASILDKRVSRWIDRMKEGERDKGEGCGGVEGISEVRMYRKKGEGESVGMYKERNKVEGVLGGKRRKEKDGDKAEKVGG